MFRPNTVINPVTLNCVLHEGGLGDNICRMPAIKYILDHYPYVSLKILGPKYFKELCLNFLRDYDRYEYIEFTDLSAMDEKLPAISGKCLQHTNMKYHMVKHAFNLLVDIEPTLEQMTYPTLDVSGLDLSKFYLPNEYIVLTPCFTSKTREFDPNVFLSLVETLKQKGHQIVFLGAKEAIYNNSTKINGQLNEKISMCLSSGKNLINQTTLLEAGKILSEARVVIGVDNGLIHLAACSKVPIVCGFTSVDPEHRMPIRDGLWGVGVRTVVPDPELPCRFCQSNMGFLYKHNFTNCLYKDYKCIQQLTLDKWLKAIEVYI